MGLLRRDVAGDVTSFSSTFSSFDNCMSKNVCKIPFIVICVVGGLIIFSILWCFLRCCLCGYRCCTCCCGGCGGRREKQKSQSDREILQPPPIIVQQPVCYQPPQYAYFDTNNDDALLVMPSLDKAQRIEISVKEEHELSPMGPMDSKGYGYSYPPADLPLSNHGPQYPTPVRGYEQSSYPQTPNQPNIGYEPSAHAYVPSTPQSLGDQQNIMQRNMACQEPSNYSQQSQPSWNEHGNEHNRQNDYRAYPSQHQGPRSQYAPDASNYHNQRSQEGWTVV